MQPHNTTHGTRPVRTTRGVITTGIITTSVAALLLSGMPAAAQTGVTFSIDFQGPTGGPLGPFSGVPDSFTGARIDEGSILTAFIPGPPGPNPASPGPLPPPGMMTSAILSGAGTVPGGLGITPGLLGAVELDALSYGRDQGPQLAFSVDEFAVGIPGAPVFPNVTSEGAGGTREASADVYTYLGPAVPTGPGPVIGNKGLIDGNGVGPFGGPGLGLREPNPPTPGQPFDQGDNLDAVDLDTMINNVKGPVFFSMDSDLADPLEGFPANSGTALGNGFVGGDVVVTPAVGSGLIGVYAPAAALGLDLNGLDTDDLDALILRDDGAVNAVGMPFFDPAADFLLFSVRRGSAVIGALDSLLGLPIEEGDVLTLPVAGAGTPSIFIPAERLGLMTARSFGARGDELDAMDLVVPEPASAALLGLASVLLLGKKRTKH
jgi:hypothetical protein